MIITITGVDGVITLLMNTAKAAASAGDASAVIGTDVSYARYVHDGTRPHIITARNAKALRWESGGVVHFATSVKHPGYKGNPFLTDALTASEGEVVTALALGMDAVTKGGEPSVMTDALMEAGLIVEGGARQRVNVRTGQLRDSLHTELITGRLP